MILFTFSNTLKQYIHSHIENKKGIHFESIFQNVYRYLEHVFKNIIQYPIHITIHYDLDKLDNEVSNEFEAFTTINNSDINKNPTHSTIFFTKSFLDNRRRYSRKYMYYVILHECIHALGIMYDSHTKWSSFLNESETSYIYKGKKSKAIEEYTKLHLNKHNNRSKEIPLHVENCSHTDKHHILNTNDVFSSPLCTNVSPVTIGLLYDYYFSK